MEEHKLLFKIMEEIYDSVIVVDRNSRIVYVNKSYQTVIADPEHIVGRKVREIEPSSQLLKVLEDKVPLYNRRQLIETAGIEVMASFLPLMRNGELVGAVAVGRTIFAHHTYHKELKENKKPHEVCGEKSKDKLPEPFQEIVGEDPSFIDTLYRSAAVSETGANVLVFGESGVGKEVLSKAIHQTSSRKDQNLEVVNCAAIPYNLLESELFGYEPGAFTGASTRGKKGKFELAHGGTLVLDEIGDFPYFLQAKLLRAIQFGTFERVGGVKPLSVDIRIIASTNRDLWNMVQSGDFRDDLYYRLNVFPIRIPPLRERGKDILFLAQKILSRINRQDSPMQPSGETENMLISYSWPGNVRELENSLEHAYVCAVSEGENFIRPRHLPLSVQKNSNPAVLKNMEKGKSLPEIIKEVEARIISESLVRNDYNKSRAIEELGISRGAFYEKLKKYSL